MAGVSAAFYEWQVNSVALSSDGAHALCGDRGKKLTLLEAASGNIVWQKDIGGAVRASLTLLLWSCGRRRWAELVALVTMSACGSAEVVAPAYRTAASPIAAH